MGMAGDYLMNRGKKGKKGKGGGKGRGGGDGQGRDAGRDSEAAGREALHSTKEGQPH